MSTQVSYPHIEKTLGEPARLKRIPRIRVAQIVMDYLGYGWSAEEMCRQHPYLSPAEAHAAMVYYYDHLEEIDHEIASEVKQVDADKSRAAPSPFFLRMRAQGIL